MSNIGTSVAASVAQTALQAQQVARVRDKRQAQTDHAADHLRKEAEEHLSVLDEVDAESPDQLTIDGRLPHHGQEREQEPLQKRDQVDPSAQTQPTKQHSEPSAPDNNASGDLYHHVDVKA